MQVGTKVGLGFTLITLFLVGAVAIGIQQALNMEKISKRVVNLRVPTVQTSLMLLNGVNHSLAGLRGWMLLGEEIFNEEQANAWTDEIEPSLKKLEELSANWTDPGNLNRLGVVQKKLATFKKHQDQIQKIAWLVENRPAHKILFEEAVPLEKTILAHIATMIELETKIKPTPERKELLGAMADIEVVMSTVLANIESYLISGEKKFIKGYEKLWERKSRRFKMLEQNIELLTEEQKRAFNNLGAARTMFEPLPAKMIQIRSGEKWNKANLWLGTKAAPTAQAIKNILYEMVASQNSLLVADEKELKDRAHSLITTLLALLFGGGLISGVLGSAITRQIKAQLEEKIRPAKIRFS